MQLLNYIALAFASGILLNVMPCVLPVLTMKVFHAMEHLNAGPRVRRLHGLAYTAGVLTAFLGLALVVLVLRSSGQFLQWGMHFQNPAFVGVLTAIVFAFALNALGVFELNLSLRAGRPQHGPFGAYLGGIFAAVMSTPCTAPLLITVTGFALASATVWWHMVLVFLSIGLGLAFPFLIFSFVEAIARLLPRPGGWMVVFKHVMGFTLLATAIWLYGVLLQQIELQAATLYLGFLLVLAVALWAVQNFGSTIHSTGRRYAVRLVAIAVTFSAGFGLLDFSRAAPKTESAVQATAEYNPISKGHINWVGFDVKRFDEEKTRRRPIFVDFTAEWCAACKTNEQVFLETSPVHKALVDTGVLPMKADLTNENPIIEQWLSKLGRTGIPAYAIYMPDGSVDLLPVVITTDMVVKHLNDAAKKFPKTEFVKDASR